MALKASGRQPNAPIDSSRRKRKRRNMPRFRLVIGCLSLVLAASVCRAQTLAMNFSGIMVFIPPGAAGDPMGIAMVDGTSDSMQHKGFLVWNPNKTTISSTTGWNCSSIAQSWKACDLGPAGEDLALNSGADGKAVAVTSVDQPWSPACARRRHSAHMHSKVLEAY